MSKNDELLLMMYKHIYIEYTPALISFARKFVATEAAEDLVQDLFVKLWDKQIFFLPENEIRRILYVALRNLCINYINRQVIEKKALDVRVYQLKIDELNYYRPEDEDNLQENLLNQILNHIEKLPPQSREIFKMSYFQNMKAAEIAKNLNISVRTVENHLYRSLLFLKKNCGKLLIFLFAHYFS